MRVALPALSRQLVFLCHAVWRSGAQGPDCAHGLLMDLWIVFTDCARMLKIRSALIRARIVHGCLILVGG